MKHEYMKLKEVRAGIKYRYLRQKLREWAHPRFHRSAPLN
jgi:hypothetical protein